MTWLLPLAGYLMGSVPTGVILGRLVGRDPRRSGSGNIGATNVTRALGRKWGAVTLLADVGKGAATVLAADWLAPGDWTLATLTGGGAIVGHCYPIWLRLRGGKGVATAFGTFLVFTPMSALVAALAWVFLVFITRVPAIGSLAAALIFVVLTRTTNGPFVLHVYALAVAALLFWRHRANLAHLGRRGKRGR